MRPGIASLIAVAFVATPLALAAKAPDNWDGLVRVKSKRADAVYLMPSADFRAYNQIMIDTPEIAFRKNWQRDASSAGRRVSDEQVREALDEARTSFARILAESFTKAGYQVVDRPGPGVLRLATGVINISVDAPDTMSAGRSRTYSSEAGQATLVLEAMDSVSGALLGRALDQAIVGGNGPYLRDSVSNRADFETLFRGWAAAGAKRLGELKALSPIDTSGNLSR